MSVQIPLVELLSCFWQCITEHGGHICYEENLLTLQSKLATLSRLRDRMNTRLETADRENDLIHSIEHWSSKVEDVENITSQLELRGSQELENNCIGSCCPRNCWSRHKIGREIRRTITDVVDLNTEGEKLLATPLVGVVDKLESYLRKDDVGCVGLHGKGGVGKTTVMNEISSKLLSESQFDYVIWVVVSEDPNLDKIQVDVGKEVGFLEERWKGKNLEEKAKDLSDSLIRKRFLLLLDDIWKPFDLTNLGVPLLYRLNGSKIVFTTRSEDVCDQMGAEEKLKVVRLTEKKSLELFRQKVGEDTLGIDQQIPKLAETIANICDGLPLALIAVGRAMACKKTLAEWDHSFEVLMKSVSEISGTKDPVFALLKFSYDNLQSDTIKSCFLYCTLFPEDFSINKINLIDYWIGEGFFGELNDVNSTRNAGNNIIRTLVSACLLQDEGEDVKMHDLIREAALWIASESGKVQDRYLVEAGAQLIEAPEIGRWGSAKRISLMSNRIQSLTKAPRCDDLRTLFLGNNHLKLIADAFFQFMSPLKVLDLSGNRELTELPLGILRIYSLQYLNLSSTGITQLPVELGNLVNLKCLNLEYTYELQTIPMQVISSFSNLQVLRMIHCASSDRIIGDGIQTGGHQSFVMELQQLEHLTELTMSITREYSLEVFRSWDKFQTCTQALSLHHFKHSRSYIYISFLEVMKRLAELEFINCINLKELRIDESVITRGGSFNSLRKVSIISCSKLEDLTWLILAPNLEFLKVSRCSNMEEIIYEEKLVSGKSISLGKLEILRLFYLPKLKSIYPKALPFRCLKEIVVDECPNLKKLPLDSESGQGHRIVIQGWEEWWKNLEWEDELSRRTFLTSFKSCMF